MRIRVFPWTPMSQRTLRGNRIPFAIFLIRFRPCDDIFPVFRGFDHPLLSASLPLSCTFASCGLRVSLCVFSSSAFCDTFPWPTMRALPRVSPDTFPLWYMPERVCFPFFVEQGPASRALREVERAKPRCQQAGDAVPNEIIARLT